MSYHQAEHGLIFRIRAEDARFLIPIYIHGFLVKSVTGISVEEFLTGYIGLTQDYLERRITTVFVDGAPIDDMGAIFLKQDMVLALSSAMPGLAGATLRRNGHLSSMRNSITRRAADFADDMYTECSIHVKLFNVLATEIGPAFLKRGFYLSVAALRDLLAVASEGFEKSLIHGLQNVRKDRMKFVDFLHKYSGYDAYFSL